ncbi:MAG: lipocalin [Variovorax sp.]|jgi:apolipoprotein D and lipocalin family protein|nr:MAG: lipocalin [Variovorax sp.]
MPQRPPRARRVSYDNRDGTNAPEVVFDDRRFSASVGTIATAFCVGSVIALTAFGAFKLARAQTPVGPADGAPLMRAPLQAVGPVDLKRYAGLWHEQARLPNRFEKKCTGPVTAEYTPLADGTLEVRNRCVTADGQWSESIGAARVVKVSGQPGAGRLEVRFAPSWLSWLPAVWGDYWILKLDRDYRIALVGTPDRDYLWVLSRDPVLDPQLLEAELEYARTLGFDIDKVVITGS